MVSGAGLERIGETRRQCLLATLASVIRLRPANVGEVTVIRGQASSLRSDTGDVPSSGPSRVGWATSWRAIAGAARDKLARHPARPPRRLGIDETTFGRHRSFMTGLVGIDGPRLWDLIEGRSKKVLVDRLEAPGEGVRSIKAVPIDHYASYKAAVRDAAPLATRVAVSVKSLTEFVVLHESPESRPPLRAQTGVTLFVHTISGYGGGLVGFGSFSPAA